MNAPEYYVVCKLPVLSINLNPFCCQVRNYPDQYFILVTEPYACTRFVPKYYSVVFRKGCCVSQYYRNWGCVSHYSHFVILCS